MKDDFVARDCAGDAERILDLAGHHFHFSRDVGRHVLEMPAVVARVVVHERSHVSTL